MHIVVNFDTSNGTAGNRMRMYVNGSEVTAFSADVNPSLNADSTIMDAAAHYIGSTHTPSDYADVYLSEYIYIDGTQLDATSFGETDTNGNWIPVNPTGLTFGTNGFWLNFANSADLGNDVSGNNNDFTLVSITSANATNDNPADNAAGGVGNYAIWNPLNTSKNISGSYTLSTGNRYFGSTSPSTIDAVGSTLIIPTDNIWWYWEHTVHSPDSNYPLISVGNYLNLRAIDNYRPGSASGAAGVGTSVSPDGYFVGGSDTENALGASYQATTDGDVQQFRFNGSTGELQLDVNNTGTYTTVTTLGDNGPWIVATGSGDTNYGTVNFGQVDFAYAPEAGDKLLNTANLPAPAVPNYEDEYYIEAGISHTNGATTAVTLPKTVSGGAMARIKRTDSTGAWYVVDTVRGANKFVTWETGATEDTSTWTDQNLSGTTLTLPSALATGTYLVEVFYVGSYFQMGTWTASSSTQTITYDTALDSELGLLVNFNRNAAGAGVVYHKDLATGKVMFTDNTSAETTRSDYSSDPDNVNFDVVAGGTSPDFVTGRTFVYWAWANSGPYAFGSYTGNLNANGPVVYIGGSPASFMTKRNEAAWNWAFHAQALGANENYQYLIPNATNAINATTTVNEVDFSATGYKVRDGDNNNINGSGIEHLYMAFGITPIGGSGISQGRAR